MQSVVFLCNMWPVGLSPCMSFSTMTCKVFRVQLYLQHPRHSEMEDWHSAFSAQYDIEHLSCVSNSTINRIQINLRFSTISRDIDYYALANFVGLPLQGVLLTLGWRNSMGYSRTLHSSNLRRLWGLRLYLLVRSFFQAQWLERASRLFPLL